MWFSKDTFRVGGRLGGVWGWGVGVGRQLIRAWRMATVAPASPAPALDTLYDAAMSEVSEDVIEAGTISVGRGNPDHMVTNRPYPRPRLYIEVSDRSEDEAPPPSPAPEEIVILSESDVEAAENLKRRAPSTDAEEDVEIVNVVKAPSPASVQKKRWEELYRLYSRLIDLRATMDGGKGNSDYGAADMERLQRIARESFSQPARRSTARISSTVAAASPDSSSAHRPTLPPSAKQMEDWEEHCSAFLFLNGIDVPTKTSAEALGVSLLAAERYLNKTEPIGVYLIQRGFPLIGKGRYSLVFLLNDTYVAKVAKYRAEHKDKGYLYGEHVRERNIDVALYRDYPTTNAETRYVRVNVEEPLYTTYHLYIQELLSAPFYHGGLDPDEVSRDENAWMIAAMLVRNQGAHEMNQWGTTRVRRHVLVRADGTQEERERRWLVRFDNE